MNMTTGMLGKEIIDALHKEGCFPEIIDYALPEQYDSVEIWDIEFEPEFVLRAGGSEGYYLDLFIIGKFSKDDISRKASLGTIKTLHEEPDAIRQMCKLYADCLIIYYKLVNEHMSDFIRKGYDVLFFKSEENKNWTYGYSRVSSIEDCRERWNKVSNSFHHATVTKNETKEVVTWYA